MSTDVFALAAETPVSEALRELRTRQIRRAPILTADGRLAAFVTKSDLVQAMPGTLAEIHSAPGIAAASRPVGDLGRRKVRVAQPNDHVEDLARLFMVLKIGGAPVVDDDRVVGIVTESDIFRAVVSGAHLADAERVTIQRAQTANAVPPFKLVQALGLELAGLTEYPGPGGRAVVVLRVRGERASELGPALARVGWVLLDRKPPTASAWPRRAAG